MRIFNAPSHAKSSSIGLQPAQTIRLPRATDGRPVESNIITIQGQGMPSVAKWSLDQELQEAAKDSRRSLKLHLYHHVSTENACQTSWKGFWELAARLADDIAELALIFPARPTIFVAHSLGGVLLKKALTLASERQHDERYRLLMNSLAGILFLGTPHVGANDNDTIGRYAQLTSSWPNKTKPPATSKSDRVQLAMLGTSYRKIAKMPMLSVYEELTPHRGVRDRISKKSRVLVDKDFATISVEAEKFLGVHLSHEQLCEIPRLQDGNFSARLFLKSLLEDIVENSQRVPEAVLQSAPAAKSDPLNPRNLPPIDNLRIEMTKMTFTDAADVPESIRKATNHSLSAMPRASKREATITRETRLDCFEIPKVQDRTFTGREAILDKIDQALFPAIQPMSGALQSSRRFALWGAGGVGKTGIVSQYAFTKREKFGPVLWLEATSTSRISIEYARFAQYLGLEEARKSKYLGTSIELVKEWFESTGRNHDDSVLPWLLIIDNADDPDLIADFVPYEGNGAVLMTSRNPDIKEYTDQQGEKLHGLSNEESTVLLKKLIPHASDGLSTEELEASMTLVEELEGFPLALTQVGGFLRRKHLSIRDFVIDYGRNYAEMRNFKNPAQRMGSRDILATAYYLDGLNPDATKLLRLISFLDSEWIPEDVFKLDMRQTFESISAYEAARLELISTSLLERLINQKALRVHRIIQQEARATLTEEKDRYDLFCATVGLVAEIWPKGSLALQESQSWPQCEILLPHLEGFYEHYQTYAAQWQNFTLDIKIPEMLCEAAIYLRVRGFAHEGKPYLRLALDLCQMHGINQEPLVSGMHLAMGALANVTNDVEICFKHNVEMLAIRQKITRETNKLDKEIAFAYSQMGIAFTMKGQYVEATEHFKQSMDMFHQLDIDEEEHAYPLCNLGLALWIQGIELDEMDEILTGYLQRRQQRYGRLDNRSYTTGRVLQALGNIRMARAERFAESGDEEKAEIAWSESFALHKDTLEQFKQTLGEVNHFTADACYKVAEHHIRRKDHAAAQKLLDRAINIWGDRPRYRNESARAAFVKGSDLLDMDNEVDRASGAKWIERARALRKQILPGEEEGLTLGKQDYDELVTFWSR